jgi:hypothetical protein
MVWLLCVRIEVVVKLVHGRYDCGDAGRVLREEESSFLVLLYVSMYQWWVD